MSGLVSDYYIGVMSGTSLDGIDVALVSFEPFKLIATHSQSFEPQLKSQLIELTQPGHDGIHRMGQAEQQLARAYAKAVQALLEQQSLAPFQVTIGLHGQTIRHEPTAAFPYTLQIGDPHTVAELTGCRVISDFRRRDMAAGGQGAPLVCAFHQALWRSSNINRAIVNIGGMANVTWLPADVQAKVIGFDTGPGNVLLDGWYQQHHQNTQQAFDDSGHWAASGQIDLALLAQLLEEPYLKLPSPKSTGRELFHFDWLLEKLQNHAHLSPVNVQTTLAEYTAKTIVDAILPLAAGGPFELFVCGGGAFNQYLLARMSHHACQQQIQTTLVLGISPQWVECSAFAWLAMRCVNRLPGNVPSVTGASGERVLGVVYCA